MSNNDRMTEILNRLVSLVGEYHLAELTVEENGLTVSVKGLSEAEPPDVISVPIHSHLLPAAQTPAYSQTPVTVPPAAAPVATLDANKHIRIVGPEYYVAQ